MPINNFKVEITKYDFLKEINYVKIDAQEEKIVIKWYTVNI